MDVAHEEMDLAPEKLVLAHEHFKVYALYSKRGLGCIGFRARVEGLGFRAGYAGLPVLARCWPGVGPVLARCWPGVGFAYP